MNFIAPPQTEIDGAAAIVHRIISAFAGQTDAGEGEGREIDSRGPRPRPKTIMAGVAGERRRGGLPPGLCATKTRADKMWVE
jgi:hypothetical protein